MPTASVKTEKPAPVDSFKQGLVIVEHKIRNLEKRKARLEVYQETKKTGKELEKEQIAALEKYDEVVQLLEFTRELYKQLNTVAIDCAKNFKKQARKEAAERAQHEQALIKETLIIQEVLSHMGQEEVREDFLQGRAGIAVTPEELQQLDDLFVELTPKRDSETVPFIDQFQAAADCMMSLLEAKPKQAFGTTYQALKDKITEIINCGYFDKNLTEVPNAVEVVEHPPVDPVQPTPPIQEQIQTIEPVVVKEEIEQPPPLDADQILSVTFQSSAVNEEPRGPPQPVVDPAFFAQSHLSVFKSGPIDFMQDNELDTPDVDSTIPTLTYTNQSFNPLDPVPAPPQPAPAQPEQPPREFLEVSEDKEWKMTGTTGGSGDAPNPNPMEWVNEPPVQDDSSWVQQCDTWQQQPAVNDGFIPAGGRGGGRGRGRGGTGDKGKPGNNRGRGGNNTNNRGGYRGGDNGYYQNGYRERGDKINRGGTGGRGGQNSERPSGNRGGRGRGGGGGTGFRGGNAGGVGGGGFNRQ